MGVRQGGDRVKALSAALRAASAIYSFSRKEGITAVRLLNAPTEYANFVPGKVNPLMGRIVFDGLTMLGTGLRDRVLVNYVTPEMKRPLLVVIITDGEVRLPRSKNLDCNSLM